MLNGIKTLIFKFLLFYLLSDMREKVDLCIGSVLYVLPQIILSLSSLFLLHSRGAIFRVALSDAM